MPRLYLIVFFIAICFAGSSQNKLKKIISFADEQYEQGDYYYALDYYKQALEQDSNSIELLWKYAETQKAYKNYVEAENYYGKVYAREQTTIYENSLLNLGLMQKQNGNYKQALKTFKLSAKKLEGKRASWFYKKSVREVESTKWVLENKTEDLDSLIHLPLTVNSYNAEFPHDFKDNRLVFSSLKADSLSNKEEVYSKSYRNKIYYSERDSLGKFKDYKVNEDLLNNENNYGNGSFSSDGTKFYYSTCNDNGFSYTCKILVTSYIDGKFQVIDTLGSSINQNGKNSTMPRIAKIDGLDYLFFCSNRRGSVGGLDIWVAQSIDGIQFKEPRNISTINTFENEISPWYDSNENKLFFSSTWHDGFGGQDVHYSDYVDGVFSSPMNALEPINSPANDMYYFKHDDTTYLASNRLGGYYSKNPTCCSDIYMDYPEIEVVTETTEDTIEITEIITKILPITLYFRNDEPDASTMKTSTKQNYFDTYKLYVDRYNYYKTEVAKGLGQDDSRKLVNELVDFFSNQVDKGISDLELFKTMILDELRTGSEVSIFIRGFASPVANTAYNINLTKRRISSLINYFKEVDDGAFKKYLGDASLVKAKLSFAYAPFGEYAADQNTSDDVVIQNESVFSKAAGIERKIEIESMTIKRNKTVFPLESEYLVQNLKESKSGDILSTSFVVKNTSNTKIKLDIKQDNKFLKIKEGDTELLPNKTSTIRVLFDTKNLTGHQSQSFKVSVEGYEGQLTFFVNTELK